MNRVVCISIILCLSGMMFAYPVLIRSWNVNEDVKALNELKVSIDNVNRNTRNIIVDVRNDTEFEMLLNNAYNAVKLADTAKEYALRLQAMKPEDRTRDEYLTYTQYNQFMIDTAAQNPNICQLIQFGTSIQNRPLYFLKITDNPTVEEAEPEFKYSAAIHGNEWLGYNMCVRLIQLLTSEYGTNTRITNLINDTEIWICPIFNVDGFAAVQRYNAAGIDLNRNYPMPTGEQHPDGNDWAPENVAMMNLCNAHNFVLSANFHGGALVMNYPWDYTYTLATDDLLLQELSLAYSTHNLPMYNSTEFEDGITNGADWYVIAGSMQDWNYGLTDCIDITAEICLDYVPPTSSLPTYWTQNQESMLSYMEAVHKGVRGLVSNSFGTPLSASISVTGNTKIVHTDPDVGDYHRMLLPGTYQITASCPGYISQTATVTVTAISTALQNFELQSATMTLFRGQVCDQNGIPVIGATVVINSTPVTSVQTDSHGCFEAQIYEGDYEATISANLYGICKRLFSVSTEDFRNIFMLQTPVFTDGFENGIDNWVVTGSWAITTNDGSQVLTDSPAGNYGNNQNRPVRLQNPLMLTNVSNPILSFRCKYDLESGYDYLYVETSANGSIWTQLASFTGSQSSWNFYSYSLASYAGSIVHLRFRLSTDSSQTEDGVYIDDVSVTGLNGMLAIYGDATGEAVINMADCIAINEYANGLDPLPATDPRPWTDYRLNNADADNNGVLDAFDSYLVMKRISVSLYQLPVVSDYPEPVDDPGLTVEYDEWGQGLSFYFSHPEYLKSLMFSTSPVNLGQVEHMGNTMGAPYDQSFNGDADSYSFAGYNVLTQSITALLVLNPASFTLQYSINGVPGSMFVDTSVAGDDPYTPAPVFSLEQNYPNPFTFSTRISLSVKDSSQASSLRVYNSRGQLVRTLADGLLESGKRILAWDGRDENGNPLSSGIYLYRLQNGNDVLTRKMILIK